MSPADFKQPITVVNPCPFCGGRDAQVSYSGMIWTGIQFTAPLQVSISHYCFGDAKESSVPIVKVGADYESALAAWNRRTPDGAKA